MGDNGASENTNGLPSGWRVEIGGGSPFPQGAYSMIELDALMYAFERPGGPSFEMLATDVVLYEKAGVLHVIGPLSWKRQRRDLARFRPSSRRLHDKGRTDEQQHACHRHQQPQPVSPALRSGPFDMSHDIPLNPTLGTSMSRLARHYSLIESAHIAVAVPAHGRCTQSFDLEFACVCLIALMRARRADRVGGNAPFVSFAS